jgi:hypothetical protein
MQQPPTVREEPGLLSKLGHWAISPEGMLAIGTTLRAGTGSENAFDQQQKIQAGWQASALQRRKDLAAKATQQAWLSALERDENGNVSVNPQKLLQARISMATPDNPLTVDELRAISELAPKSSVSGEHIIQTKPFGGGITVEGDLPASRADILGENRLTEEVRSHKAGEATADARTAIERTNSGIAAGQLANARENTGLSGQRLKLELSKQASALGIPFASNDADYQRLPPGQYLAPDGTVRTKR